jgi:hypothetical protein
LSQIFFGGKRDLKYSRRREHSHEHSGKSPFSGERRQRLVIPVNGLFLIDNILRLSWQSVNVVLFSTAILSYI